MSPSVGDIFLSPAMQGMRGGRGSGGHAAPPVFYLVLLNGQLLMEVNLRIIVLMFAYQADNYPNNS